MASISGDTLKDGDNEAQEMKRVSSGNSIDPIRRRQLLRKLDLHLLPITCSLYFFICISRTAFNNALSNGMTYDLRMNIRTWANISTAYFVTHVVLIIPSNIILKSVRPSIYIPLLITVTGILTIGSGVTKSVTGLYVCQTLQGIFDAGIFPGLIYYLSTFYPRTRFQLRLNFLFSAAFLSNTVSGFLANGIGRMSGVGGYRGWRWIFILEGLLTFLVGVSGFFFLRDWPERARFLDEEDRKIIHDLASEEHEDASMDRLDVKALLRIVLDIKIWLGAIIYFSSTASNFTLSWFSSLTISRLSLVNRPIRLEKLYMLALQIPLWITTILVVLCTGYVSDRLRHHYSFILSGVVITSIGYALLFNYERIAVGASYFAEFLFTGGVFTVETFAVGWLCNNLARGYQRAIGIGFQIAVGNVSGLMTIAAYDLHLSPPAYPGLALGLGMIWVSAVAATIMMFYLRWENKARDQGKRDGRYQLSEREKENLGDAWPGFRFIL